MMVVVSVRKFVVKRIQYAKTYSDLIGQETYSSGTKQRPFITLHVPLWL